MKKSRVFLAVDFGASSGKVVCGKYDGEKLKFKEIYSFENRPVYLVGNFYWDILRLYSELKISLQKSVTKYKKISSIGVDTWGIDFGLFDRFKKLMQNPVHYRDKRTDGISDKVFQVIDEKSLYLRTGVQFLKINTIFQIYSMVLSEAKILMDANYLLMIGDILNYFLTGEMVVEYTNATTT